MATGVSAPPGWQPSRRAWAWADLMRRVFEIDFFPARVGPGHQGSPRGATHPQAPRPPPELPVPAPARPPPRAGGDLAFTFPS